MSAGFEMEGSQIKNRLKSIINNDIVFIFGNIIILMKTNNDIQKLTSQKKIYFKNSISLKKLRG